MINNPEALRVINEMTDHLAEVVDDDADLHTYAAQATVAQLGDPDGPKGEQYWSTYNEVITRAFLELVLRTPKGRY